MDGESTRETSAVPKEGVPGLRTYAAPCRYDLVTLLIVIGAYACLFGVLRAGGAGTSTVVRTTLFLTAVGIAQAVLFRGRDPRGASMIAGIAFLYVQLAVKSLYDKPPRNSDHIIALLLVYWGFGAVLGYLGGVAVSGVFLVAHYIRRLVRLSPPRAR